MSLFTKCLNLDNIALPLISSNFVYMYFSIQVFINKNAEIFNLRGCINSFSTELNFEVQIIVFIACFKKNNFCFCYIECNFISIKPKGKLSKFFVQSSVNGTHAVLDVYKACIIGKMKGEESLIELCKSIMYKRKSRGPRNDPCGIPKLTLTRSDEIPLIETCCILFVRQDLNQSLPIPLIP